MDSTALSLSGQSVFNSAMLRAKAHQAEQATQAATAKLGTAKLNEIDKVAKDFEGMFLGEMLSHMFAGLEVDPQFGGGKGEEMFRGLMISEYGKQIAHGPGIGIAQHVRETMIALQSAQSPAE